jgi:hypothetical protein
MQALRMANGEPNRAFEIIMQLGNMEEGEGLMEGDYGDDDYQNDEEGSQPVSGGNMFEALAQNPNFALIRQRIL